VENAYPCGHRSRTSFQSIKNAMHESCSKRSESLKGRKNERFRRTSTDVQKKVCLWGAGKDKPEDLGLQMAKTYREAAYAPWKKIRAGAKANNS